MVELEILDLVDRIYGIVLDPTGLPDVLTDIAHTVDAIGTLVLPLKMGSNVPVLFSPSLTDSIREYERGWRPYDRRLIAGVQRGLSAGVVADRELLSDAEIRRDPFYQDFLAPQGFGNSLSYLSTASPGETYCVTVERGIRAEPVGDDERARLSVLGRHLGRAVALLGRLDHELSLRTSLIESLDLVSAALIVLDRDGSVIHVNRAAGVCTGQGFDIRHRKVHCASPDAQRDFDTLVAGALSTRREATLSAVMIPRAGLPPLLVQALPLSSKTADRFSPAAFKAGRVLLCLHNMARSGPASVAQLFRLLGLTAGEARVADAVGTGLAPKEVADRLGIKEASVRQVLKAVYSKLGLVRQSQVAVLATRLGQMLKERE